ncbi:ATP-binding protein [Elusimicrobiota bacterium]
MNLFTVAGLTCGVSVSILAIIAFIYGKTPVQRALALFNTSVAIWGFGCFFVGKSLSEESALLAWRLGQTGGIFIAVFFYHMIHIFCHLKNTTLLKIIYVWGIVFLFFCFFTDLLFARTYFIYGVHYNEATLLYGLLVFSWLSVVILSFARLVLFLPSAKGAARIQTIYIIFGFLTGFVGGASTLIPMFGLQIPPYGNFTIVIYSVIATYAILKLRILDFNIAITRAGIFLILYTAILGVPFYIGYRSSSWILSTGIAVILASIGPIVYRILQEKAEALILAEQRRYQKVLVQAAEGMAREHDLERLLKLIAHIVKRIVKIHYVAIFLYDKEKECYDLRAMRDYGKEYNISSFKKNNPLSLYLQKHHEPFLIEELSSDVRNELEKKMHSSLIVPSFYEKTPIGFMVLGEKINKKMYTGDDINVFKILSQQTALAIENCLFVDEFKKAQERLFAAEKLASIGGMADGVAHQIRNRLNHFSLASGEQKIEIESFMEDNKDLVGKNEVLKESLTYLKETAESILSNVDKTKSIVNGILNFARVEDKDTSFTNFSFKEVLHTVIEAVRTKHEIEEFPIKINAPSDDTVYGVKVQIRESLFNVIDNGFEATKEKMEFYLKDDKDKKEYKPEIMVDFKQEIASAVVRIRDNGIGIKDENKHKIFAPFFTTKSSYKSGTGIGMYVVKRMIEENHKGSVTFDSKYGHGTTITIKLPKRDKKS